MSRDGQRWTLKAETTFDYRELVLWECRNPKTKFGLVGIPSQAVNPLIRGSLVVAATRNPGVLSACNTVTGDLVWRTPIGSSIAYAPVANETNAFVSDHQTLFAFGLNSGNVEWSIPHQTYAQPVVAEDRLIVGDAGGWIDCLESATGRSVWRQQVSHASDPRLNGTPSLVKDFVISGSNSGIVAAFDLNSGELLWRKRSLKAWTEGTDFHKTGAIIRSVHSVSLIDPKTGQTQWRKLWSGSEFLTMCMTESAVVIPLASRKKLPVHGSPGIHFSPERLVGLRDGKECWSLPYDPWPNTRLSYSPETQKVYEATTQGLGIIDPATGTRECVILGFPLKGLYDDKVDAPNISNGVIYCHHSDGRLLALRHP